MPFLSQLTTQRRRIYLALLVALMARLAMYPFSGIEQPAYFEYGDIAHQLVSGEGYYMHHWFDGDRDVLVPSAWMPPGQVMIDAAFFRTFGEQGLTHHLIFLLNALLGTAAVYVLGRSMRLLHAGDRLESITLFAAALYPPFISASSTWGIASSALLLNSLLIYTAIRFSQALSKNQLSLKYASSFGLAAGVLSLFRAEAPLTVAFILLGMAIFHRREIARLIKPYVLAGVIMFAIMSPWLIANFIRFDSVILGSTSGGFNLWRGNNPTASGGGWRADGTGVLPPWETQEQILNRLHGIEPLKFERAYSSELASLAVEWVRSNPGEALGLAVKKCLLIWVLDLYHPSNAKYLYAVCHLIALTLAIIGFRSLRKKKAPLEFRRWLWIAGGVCVASTLLTMVFFSLPRYQIFLVGYYFPLVALGMHAILQKRGLRVDAANTAARIS
jgi:hypothetical protein